MEPVIPQYQWPRDEFGRFCRQSRKLRFFLLLVVSSTALLSLDYGFHLVLQLTRNGFNEVVSALALAYLYWYIRWRIPIRNGTKHSAMLQGTRREAIGEDGIVIKTSATESSPRWVSSLDSLRRQSSLCRG
jgi:hypothetical protein